MEFPRRRFLPEMAYWMRTEHLLLIAMVSSATLMTDFWNAPVVFSCEQATGDYGTPPLFSVYRIQLLAYTVILIICKAVTTAIVITADEVLSSLANALFAPVRDYPELELTIVMIICPW